MPAKPMSPPSLRVRTFDLLPEPLFVFDAAGALLDSNAAANALIATGGIDLMQRLWLASANAALDPDFAQNSFTLGVATDGVEHIYRCTAIPFADGDCAASGMLVQLIGVLSIQHIQPDAYATEHIQLLEVVAAQAAVAVENARLYAAVQAELSEHERMEAVLRNMNMELERRVSERTEELLNTVKELEHANEGKDAFMAAVSHELRTPLNGILGMVEMLESEMRGPLNAHQKRYVAGIKDSGDRLLALVNGVINYTQALGAGNLVELEHCRLAELCAVSVKVASYKAEKKRQQLSLAVEPPNLQIMSNGNSIRQILDVLLDNAVKFTPAGGRLGVEVHRVEDGKAVQVTVWDTGIGITPEQRPYLFRVFSQADQRLAREFEGIGLGLALVKRKTEILGGTVAVESQPGEGSKFIIKLPSNAPARNTWRHRSPLHAFQQD